MLTSIKCNIFQAALSLRESYILKAPNSKLSGKDKAAIVAKELGDFLGHYRRETELYTVFREESGMVPRHIFEEFIAFASDSGNERYRNSHSGPRG